MEEREGEVGRREESEIVRRRVCNYFFIEDVIISTCSQTSNILHSTHHSVGKGDKLIELIASCTVVN